MRKKPDGPLTADLKEYSPYKDKKLGEFFEPNTPKRISQLGMKYKFPDKMKKVKGYNFSRNFMGERVPQHAKYSDKRFLQ